MPSAGLGQQCSDDPALTTVERDFFRGLNTFAKTPERILIDAESSFSPTVCFVSISPQ